MVEKRFLLNRYWDSEKKAHMIDIRFWKKTKDGWRPTDDGISISIYRATLLIAALQKEYSEFSAEAARLLVGTDE